MDRANKNKGLQMDVETGVLSDFTMVELSRERIEKDLDYLGGGKHSIGKVTIELDDGVMWCTLHVSRDGGRPDVEIAVGEYLRTAFRWEKG